MREKNEMFNNDIVCPLRSGDWRYCYAGVATMCHLFAQCDFRNEFFDFKSIFESPMGKINTINLLITSLHIYGYVSIRSNGIHHA